MCSLFRCLRRGSSHSTSHIAVASFLPLQHHNGKYLLYYSVSGLNYFVAKLTPEQMEAMLRSEHGGMNEVLADVAQITGDKKYLDLALRFSHQAVLEPLAKGQDKLAGLHANTQIPKVIGLKRIADMTGRQDLQRAAQFFWQTVHDHRTVAIGGNSVKEHFHDQKDFSPMIKEVEGRETCWNRSR